MGLAGQELDDANEASAQNYAGERPVPSAKHAVTGKQGGGHGAAHDIESLAAVEGIEKLGVLEPDFESPGRDFGGIADQPVAPTGLGGIGNAGYRETGRQVSRLFGGYVARGFAKRDPVR